MPSSRYNNRRPVAVPIPGVTGLYGFLTGIATADSNALGHTELTGDGAPTDELVFYGASRPKPGRARKAGDTTSSYYNAAASLPAGWKAIKRAKLPPLPGISEKSKAVYVPIDDGFYVWKMPLETYLKVGDDRAGLGIADLTSTIKGFIGANTIDGTSAGRLGKPPRARKEVTGAGGIDVISTFCKFPVPTTVPEGWTIT